MNYSDHKFEAPFRTDLESVGRHYYTQAAKHQNADIYLATALTGLNLMELRNHLIRSWK